MLSKEAYLQKQAKKYDELIEKCKKLCDADKALETVKSSTDPLEDPYYISVVKGTYTHSVLHPKMLKMKGVYVDEEKVFVRLTCYVERYGAVIHRDLDDITVSDETYYLSGKKYCEHGYDVYGLNESKYWFDYPIRFDEEIDGEQSYSVQSKYHEVTLVNYTNDSDFIESLKKD